MNQELCYMTLAWVGLFLLSLGFLGCSSNDHFAFDVQSQELLDVKQGENPIILPGGSSNSSDDVQEPTEDDSCPDCGDTDDPIEDPEDPDDDFDETCFTLRLDAYGVSSGVVELNGERVIAPNTFHNQNDLTVQEPIELDEGTNVLEFAANLRGSPGDRLEIKILNCADPELPVLYETILTRDTGTPQTETFTVDL